MLRTRLGKVLVTASIVLAPALGLAAPAGADFETSASWHYVGRYSSLSACTSVGRHAVDEGWADSYRCDPVAGSNSRDLYYWY